MVERYFFLADGISFVILQLKDGLLSVYDELDGSTTSTSAAHYCRCLNEKLLRDRNRPAV